MHPRSEDNFFLEPVDVWFLLATTVGIKMVGITLSASYIYDSTPRQTSSISCVQFCLLNHLFHILKLCMNVIRVSN